MLNTWVDLITNKKAEQRIFQNQINELEIRLEKARGDEEICREAHNILQTAAQMTQGVLEDEMQSIVTMALATVFEEKPYKFVVNFVRRRNTTECDLLFETDGELIHPLKDAGFSAADIASVALKVAYWASGETRPILIFDEPCKNLSRGYHALAAMIFKELCDQLGLQMLVSTHIPDFKEIADMLFTVSMNRKGVSTITAEA